MILKTDLENLSISKLVAVHNILNPGRRVSGFRDRATAMKRALDAVNNATPSEIKKLQERMPELGPRAPEAAEVAQEAVECIESAFDPLTGTAGAAQEAEEPILPYDSEEERAMQRAAILEAETAAEEAAAPRAEVATLAEAKPTRAVRAKERAEAGVGIAQNAKKDGRGRKSNFSNSRLVSTTTVNPRRPGSHGWHSMKIIIERGADGISYDDFIAAGGRSVDLRWDIAHGNVVALNPQQ